MTKLPKEGEHPFWRRLKMTIWLTKIHPKALAGANQKMKD